MNACCRTARKVSALMLLACVSGGLVLSAQTKKITEERTRLATLAAAARHEKGLTDIEDPALWKQYPVSEIQPVAVQKVAPGGSVAVSLTGVFPPGVTILSELDGASLTGGAPTARAYSGRVTIAPDQEPGFVRLFAYTPVSFGQAMAVVAFIDRVYEFDLKSAEGYVVKVTPLEKVFTLSNGNRDATVKYQAEFYKPGETKPFQTLGASQSFYSDNEPNTRLDIDLGVSTSSPEAAMTELSNKLGDPNLTDKQRNDLMLQLSKLQQKMMDDMLKGLQTDPASLNKPTDDFGCRLLQVYPGTAPAVEGTILCGQNFNGGMLKVTGTMTVVK